MRRSLSSCLRPRHLGVSIATSLCAGALLASPSLTRVYAAPTVGGDENGPQVQILQPGYQDVLKGKTKILIAVKAQKFNPQFVEMFIDDKPGTSGPISLSALPSAQYDWDTKLFTDGPHKLTVRITDTQGFRGWAEVNVYINNGKKVDSLPPSLNWQNISSYQQLSGKASIQLDAIDNFGVKWIIVSVNPASDPNRKPAMRSWLLNRPPYIVKFDTTTVEDGLYQLSAKAWDSLEQEGVAAPLTLGVVNSGGINATTVGEMLASMRQMDAAKAKPIPASPRTTPRLTVDVPDEPAGRASNPYNQKSAETKSADVKPVVPKTLNSVPKTVEIKNAEVKNVETKSPELRPLETKSTPLAPSGPAKVSNRMEGSALRAPLPPSLPPMIVRSVDVKPAVKPPVLVAKNTVETAPESLEVAAPRLSTRSAATVSTQATTLDSEIRGAVNEDWRGRIARVALPEGVSRALDTQGQFSALHQEDLSVTHLGAASIVLEEETRIVSARAALPMGSEREFETTASLRPEDEKPALSQSVSGGALRVASNQSLRLEADATEREGRISDPEMPAARPVVALENLEVTAPVLSTPSLRTESRVASLSAATPAFESTAPAPSRLAAPASEAERTLNITLDSAQISAAPAAPSTRLSAKFPLIASNEVPKTARVGKTASPDKNRLAALPRPVKRAQSGAINAITVSPLEIKTSDAIPAFHVAARATDLRAVAARYGLPVEVVAACNAWPESKTLVAGEKVKLPHQLKVSYQGIPVQGDAPSMLVGGTGVTAFRFLFQQAGGKLEWDAKKQRVTAKKGDSEVVLTIGSNKAKVGEEEVMMELAAFLFEGRTMVPVRFFEEGLHAQVEWDPQTGRLVVAMAN